VLAGGGRFSVIPVPEERIGIENEGKFVAFSEPIIHTPRNSTSISLWTLEIHKHDIGQTGKRYVELCFSQCAYIQRPPNPRREKSAGKGTLVGCRPLVVIGCMDPMRRFVRRTTLTLAQAGGITKGTVVVGIVIFSGVRIETR
jgi:hypothetical protein